MKPSATQVLSTALAAVLWCCVAIPVSAVERAKNITFDNLKFEMKKEEPFKRSMLTPENEALDGQRFIVRGFMLPAFGNKVSKFVLVRDNMECCFGPGAAIYDSIQVDMEPGSWANFTVYQVKVEGTLTIQEYKDEKGVVRSVYHMQATKAK